MKILLKPGLIVVTGESVDELEDVNRWAATKNGHVFSLTHQDGQTFRLTDLGLRAEACREPINVTSQASDPAIRLISNLADTPFELDGRRYGSVEAFWQGLKFPDEAQRALIAPLHGHAAREAGFEAQSADVIRYQDQSIRVGTADHWQLMARACWAKFTQHEAARQALLATAPRPLEHKTRRDSRNIPGVLMADIWMKVRRGLLRRGNTTDDFADDHEDA